MVRLLASGAVDRKLTFKARLGQTKNYKFNICCFSLKHAVLRKDSKRLIGIRIM
jgi:hypothetical protein